MVAPEPSDIRVSCCGGRWTAGIFVASLALYLAGLSWDAYYGDSAQFGLQAATLEFSSVGRAYPFFRAFAWLTGILTGSPAVGANLSSAIFAAAMVALTFLVTRRLTGGLAGPLAAAAAVGFSHTLWSYAGVSEVYGLHNALMLVCLLILISDRPLESRRLFGLGLVLGLSFLHHRMMLFSAPVLVVYGIAKTAPGRRLVGFGTCVVGGLLGLVPFIVICVFDALAKIGGGEMAFSHWFMMLFVSGGEHLETLTMDVGKSALESLTYLAKFTFLNLPGPALILALAALLVPRVTKPGFRTFLWALIVMNLIFPFRFTRVGDQYAFLTPIYPLLAIAAGLSTAWIARSASRAVTIAVVASVAAAPLISYGFLGLSPIGERRLSGFTKDAARAYFIPPYLGQEPPADRCRRILDRLPRDAWLQAAWGDGCIYRYLQAVEGRRPDVTVCIGLLRRHLPTSQTVVWISIMPIWSDPEARLKPLTSDFTDHGDNLYEARINPPGGD